MRKTLLVSRKLCAAIYLTVKKGQEAFWSQAAGRGAMPNDNESTHLSEHLWEHFTVPSSFSILFYLNL